MSTIERTRPQAQKDFDPRKQDHGTAAQRKGRLEQSFREEWTDNAYQKRGYFPLGTELKPENAPTIDEYLDGLTPEELEYETDRILAGEESYANVIEFEGRQRNLDYWDKVMQFDESDDTHLNLSEAQLGIRSKAEVKKSLARQATLDPEYIDDDHTDYNDTGMNVRNVR